MHKRNLLLFGIIISILFLMVATLTYPGGSRADIHSPGFDWKNNYLTNLFGAKAINGSYNTARIWAIFGWFFLCINIVLYFIEFSKKIPSKGAANVIRYFGISGMLAAFLAVTPLHDTMITVACTLTLVSIFYCIVFIFKSNLIFLKILSIICMLVSYLTIYIYYSGNFLDILPTMQKVTLAVFVIWILSLQYFTESKDFQLKKA
jgi:hypothetical protein